MTRRLVWILALVWMAGVSQSQAKEKLSSPKVQKFEEVERGFWLRTTIGMSLAVKDMFEGDGESSIWPPGPLLTLELGYDLGQVASLHIGISGQQISGTRETSSGSVVGNDVRALVLLLGCRFNLVTSKRLAWFLKANAGWMFTAPDLVGFDSGFLVQGGTGIEYATKLRHFFIGIEAGCQYDISNKGISVIVTPSLKYTF